MEPDISHYNRPCSISQNTYEYTFTVFTSTYNRSGTIHRTYQSLRKQTWSNFEWLVVDAGSDNTADVIKKCTQEEPSFPIRYIKQENRGKHGAINYGITIARGELFIILDDDDELTPDALERFKYHWDSIPEAQRGSFAGVAVLSVDEAGRLSGTRFPVDVIDSTFSEMVYKFKKEGERCMCLATRILAQFPFPEDLTTPTIPEGTIWHRMSGHYRLRFANEVLRTYWTDQASVCRGGAAKVYASGNRIRYLVALNEELQWFWHAPITFLRMAAQYSRFSFHRRLSLYDQVASFNSFAARILWVVTLPVGFLVYCMDEK